MADQVTEVSLAEKAGVVPAAEQEKTEIEGLITFDELVMNFLQQKIQVLLVLLLELQLLSAKITIM